MIYKVRINKHIRNIKVYNIRVKRGEKPNVLTALFLKIFVKEKKEEEV